MTVALTYTFRPDDYLIGVTGQVTGVGPNGGSSCLGMGPALRNTEANEQENHERALVTSWSSATRPSAPTSPASSRASRARFSGPFEWVAVKSKYFVTAVLAFDSAGGRDQRRVAPPPRLTDRQKRPTSARPGLSLPLPADGDFRYRSTPGRWSTPGSRRWATTSTT